MTAEITTQLHANGQSAFARGWKAGLTRRVKRSVVRWAREVRKMYGGPLARSADPFPFVTDLCPHTIEQMEACDDPRVRYIVIWSAIRDMKTTAALNAMGRCMTDDPGGIMSVWPTRGDGDDFSEEDFETMVRRSPELDAVAFRKKSRESGYTKSYKRFKGGWVRFPSVGEVNAFRSKTVKVLHLPEVDSDGMRENMESLFKAMGRTKGMRAIIILESTGTRSSVIHPDGSIEWNSVIAQHYDKSDQRKWFVECAECHELSIILYPQIRAEDGDKKNAKWHCPRCEFGHTEPEWFRAAQTGLWLPTAGLSADDLLNIRESHLDAKAKEPEVRGYWRNGFNSLLPKGDWAATKLHEFLAEGESAKSSREALKTWTNEIAAELWDESEIGETPPDWEALRDRVIVSADDERGFIVPPGALILTGGADVHPDRIEWTWFGYGKGETCWVMDHRVFFGETRDHSRPKRPGDSCSSPWWKLREEVQKVFTHESGGTIGLEYGLIDCSYGWDDVWKFLQTGVMKGKLRACRGSSTYTAAVVEAWSQLVKGKHGGSTVWGHNVGTDAVKDTLYSKLRLVETPEGFPEGWIHFYDRLRGPEREDDSYFQQLTAEQVEIRLIGGREERHYKKKKMLRNETHDTWVYGYAAMRRGNFSDSRWDALQRERMKLTEPDEPEETPRVQAPQSRGGFGSGWNL